MVGELYIWLLAAFALFLFTGIFMLAVLKRAFPIIFKYCSTKDICDDLKDSLLYLKIPTFLIFVFLAADFIVLFLDMPISYLKVLNSLILLDSFFIMLYVISIVLKGQKSKWLKDKKLKLNIDAIHSTWYFIVFIFSALLFYALSFVLGIDLLLLFMNLLFVIEQNIYLSGLAVFIIFLILSNVVLYMFKAYINGVVRRTDTPYDDLILSKIEYPFSWIIIFIGIILAISKMELDHTVLMPLIYTAIIIVAMHTSNVVVDNIIDYWENKVQKHTRQNNVDEVVFVVAHNTSKVLIVITAVIFILVVWGMAQELKGILLSLSVVGVILGFALKETFSNIISGISLMTDHAFKKNDLIELETGEKGYVIKIGLRSTKIRTFDNEIMNIPNSYLGNTKVLNHAQPDSSVRIVLDVGVEYGSDPAKVKKVLLGAIEGMDFVVDENKNDVWFVEMSDFSLKFKLIFYIADYKRRYTIISRTNEMIYNALKKNGIGIPFPTRTLYMGRPGMKDKKDGVFKDPFGNAAKASNAKNKKGMAAAASKKASKKASKR